MRRVLLAGSYGFNNAGDEAMLEAITRALRERVSDLHLTVISANPRLTERQYGVEAVGRLDVLAILVGLRRCDLFISGGGSLLQDVTSDRNLTYHLALLGLARRLGAPVMLYGHGIGPIRWRLGRYLARRALNGVELITVRDESSAVELTGLGVTRPQVEVTADPVLGLPLNPDAEAGRAVLARTLPDALARGPLVGFAPRSWRAGNGSAEVLAHVVDHVQHKMDATAVLIPFKAPEDVQACERIAALAKRPPAILRGPLTVPELADAMAACGLVVGVRLHALIFAAMAGVPFVGIAYDPKIDGFVRQFGARPPGRIEDLRLEDVLFEVETLWRSRDEASRNVRERARAMGAAALRSADLAASLILRGRNR